MAGWENARGGRVAQGLRRLLLVVASLMLAAFFSFVGWNKVVASLTELARHGAWTVYLPLALGRLVGWSELACAAALLGALHRVAMRWCRAAALVLIANQFVAATVHAAHGETAALPQNGVLIALSMLVAVLAHGFSQREG